MEDDQKIIEVMKQYLVDFLEKPHSAFSDMPVCPFAKKARIENKLLYKVMKLEVFSAFIETVNWNIKPESTQALIMVHPNKDLSWQEYSSRTEQFKECLNTPELSGLSLFAAHPDSDYMDHGVYTRREPYPNWQIMRVSDLDKAQAQLRKSRWYDTVA